MDTFEVSNEDVQEWVAHGLRMLSDSTGRLCTLLQTYHKLFSTSVQLLSLEHHGGYKCECDCVY
jgi:hypothetical protein